MDWKTEAGRLKEQGLNVSEIALKTQQYFPELNLLQVKEKIRGYFRVKSPINRPKGIIGDLHAPFVHPNYLSFCQDTFKARNVDTKIFIGDVIDHHALSRFLSEPSAMGAKEEANQARKAIKPFFEAFPSAKVCIGNHDDILKRQGAIVGLSEEHIKSISEVYGFPKGWEVAEEFIIDNVLYKHGINCLGELGAIKAAILERRSTAIGHAHSVGCVNYSANSTDVIFGLSVGCGIDIKAYAFEYGKHDKKRPILGCGIVYNSTHAEFVPMSAKYFRSNQNEND